jgi:phage tail protein X
MREKRRFLRFVKLRKIRYLLAGGMGKWQECSIIDVSRIGMKIRFYEGIDVDSTIFFVLYVPGEAVPINLKGTLKRIEGSGSDFIGGVELTERLNDETFITIMNDYSTSPGRIETASTKDVSEDAYTHTQKTIPALFSKQPLTYSSFKQVFSFISSSVSLFSLVLFLSLPVFFLMVTGYFSGYPFNGDTQKKDNVVQLKGVPSSPNPARIDSEQRITAALDNRGIQNEATVHRVNDSYTKVLKEAGGSLYTLALKHYQRADETIFDLILQANPALTDIRQIHDDQKITLPAITSESYIKKITDGIYQVHVGTFEKMDVVGTYSDKVIDLGKSILIQPHRFSSKDIWYRVLLGNFKSKGEALKTVTFLNKKGIIYIPPKFITQS